MVRLGLCWRAAVFRGPLEKETPMNYYIIVNNTTQEKGVAGNLVLDVLEQFDFCGVNYAKVKTLSSDGSKVTCTVSLSCLTITDPNI